jgi:hypothetical protein
MGFVGGKLNMLKKSLIVVACAGLPAAAQDLNDAAPMLGGKATTSVIDALGDEILTGFSVQGGPPASVNAGRSLGLTVAHDAVWVTSADGALTAGGCTTAGTAGPATIMKFDLDGNWLESYEQPANVVNSSCWGYRDGAKDDANNKMYWGTGGDRMDEWDYDSGTGDITFNQTYTGGSGNTTVRALARRATTGNFYTADFGSLISEFDISSGSAVNVNIYVNLAGPGGAGSGALYGMAYDADNDTIWGWSQNADPNNGGGANTAVFAAEMDPNNDMNPTGREFWGTALTMTTTTNNIAGGADIFVHPGCGVQVFAGLHQFTTDEVHFYELDNECSVGCYADCDGNQVLDVFDFLCFQDAFVAMDPYADCDGNTVFDVFDFLCFQDAFVVGCP